MIIFSSSKIECCIASILYTILKTQYTKLLINFKQHVP